MLSRTFLWPQGYTSAAMISVNLDAEFYGRIFYPGIDVSEGDIQRLGWTGMEYGLPHLLDCFREHGVRAHSSFPGALRSCIRMLYAPLRMPVTSWAATDMNTRSWRISRRKSSWSC